MSSRIFQSVIIQMKDATDRVIGVADSQGFVVACSELSMIGQRWAEYVSVVNNAAGSLVSFDGKSGGTPDLFAIAETVRIAQHAIIDSFLFLQMSCNHKNLSFFRNTRTR